jgi:serine/threonine-protein kinase
MASKLLHYDVLERLGEGARSIIYLVRDPDTKQLYALKHVKREDQKDIRFIEQMEAEYEISRQFSHPNLRKSFDLQIKKSMFLKVTEAFLVMELVEGRSLETRLPSDMLEIVDAAVQSAQALKYMHELGYAHCDIKPNNIMRNDRGLVKVIDYGQSCKLGTVKPRIQGTPDYIAPEQVDRRPITAQTDVFNLGATLYWALTRRVIPTQYTVNKKGDNSFLLHSTIESPMAINPRVPAPISNLVMECISTNPTKRPADMDQVIPRLELGRHVLVKQRKELAEGRADKKIEA